MSTYWIISGEQKGGQRSLVIANADNESLGSFQTVSEATMKQMMANGHKFCLTKKVKENTWEPLNNLHLYIATSPDNTTANNYLTLFE